MQRYMYHMYIMKIARRELKAKLGDATHKPLGVAPREVLSNYRSRCIHQPDIHVSIDGVCV